MPRKKYSIEVIKPELEINEELELHEKGWVAQRVGWVLIFAIVVLGAFGLFGEGVISNRQPSVGNVTAQYDRFYRYEKEMKILVQSSGEHIMNIALSRPYLKHFRLVRIVPEPMENVSTVNEVNFRFAGDANGLVSIYLIPEQVGNISGSMKVNDASFELHHFIYP